MLTLSTLLHPPEVGIAWRLSNATVFVLIVDLIGPFYQIGVQVPKRPDGQFFWVNSFCEQASLFGCLRVSEQIVDELLVGGVKQALNDGPIAGCRPRASFSGAVKAC